MNGEPENADPSTKTVRVIAKYNFDGRNNDELCFQKNDIIIVTQQVEGGWWEGMIGDNIGWFPSDFVGLIKVQSNGKSNGAHLPDSQTDEAFEKTKLKFRHEILCGNDGFMKKEAEHIENLMRFPANFLPPIHEQQVLTSNEFRTVSTNILQIIEAKKELFNELENELKKDVSRQEIGAIFLKHAINFKNLLFAYCENHPLAMALIVKKRQVEIIERVLKAKGVDIKEFISALSLVFRHTEKYSSILQEVERNTSEAHLDRGNLQRACQVYRDISEDCLAIRKQKEIQLEFLSSGCLDKKFGKNYEQKLGPIVYVTSVTFLPGNDEDDAFDRCFALFRNNCLLFEIESGDKSAFVLKEQFSTSGLSISCNELLTQVKFLKDAKPLFSINSLTLDDFRRLCSVLHEFPFEEVASSNNAYNIQEVPSIAPSESRD
ncbi:hypothetical protein M3Y97_00200400 [Aphelenchoides bicaudatus]|nr:hypothetical protein M3Y97_00200400 [Aphelenchoides bicaudatus]